MGSNQGKIGFYSSSQGSTVLLQVRFGAFYLTKSHNLVTIFPDWQRSGIHASFTLTLNQEFVFRLGGFTADITSICERDKYTTNEFNTKTTNWILKIIYSTTVVIYYTYFTAEHFVVFLFCFVFPISWLHRNLGFFLKIIILKGQKICKNLNVFSCILPYFVESPRLQDLSWQGWRDRLSTLHLSQELLASLSLQWVNFV